MTMPGLFATMQGDYAAFAARDQVLPMPAGYTAEQQINTNGFNKSVRPKLVRGAALLLALAAMVGGAIWWRWRKRASAAR